MKNNFKKLLSVILSASFVVLTLAGCSRVSEVSFTPEGDKGDLSVVSFNVAGPWGSLLKGTDKNVRVKRFAAYMNSVKPDIIGTQEMTINWMDKLSSLMPDYDFYGVARGGDENEAKSEHNTIFWRKDRFEKIEEKTFWLSETPDKESRFKDAGCNRVCSYVMLKEIDSEKYVLALNTHLDNSSDEARGFGAQLILDELEKYSIKSNVAQYTVVLTGDFNQDINDVGCQLLSSRLDTIAVEGTTYQDWGNIDEQVPIDFVFTNGTPKWSMRLDDESNGYVSDHYGVYSVIDFK